jgi:hypothetical protein
MAASYSVIGSYATVQITGPTTAVDVLRITFRTSPSGVIATANAPYKNIVGVRAGDVQGIADTFIAPLAEGIERMMGSGEVDSAVAAEDVDGSGLVIDYIDATVAYSKTGTSGAGAFTQVVRIPTGAFGEPSFYDPLVGSKINAAYLGLQSLANV